MGYSITKYGHRYYDPQLGRWTSRDTTVAEGAVNPYAFWPGHGKAVVQLFDDGAFQNEEDYWRSSFPKWFQDLFDHGQVPPEFKKVVPAIPRLRFDFSKSQRLGGCLPVVNVPGLGICFGGAYAVKIGRCTKSDGSYGKYAQIDGYIYIAIKYPVVTPGHDFSVENAGVLSVVKQCPKETSPKLLGAVSVSVRGGAFKAGCTLSLTDMKWSCKGAIELVPGGISARGEGRIGVSGEFSIE